MNQPNIDFQEVDKFEKIANDWWDPQGSSKMLHVINPVRLQFILQQVKRHKHQASESQLSTCLDVGCGGGILTEALAKEANAIVTGLEASTKLVQIARTHAKAQHLPIQYVEGTAEAFSQDNAERFSVVTCMELVEHVPNPQSVIHACSQLVAPGGHLFFSTLNRTPKAWLMAILGAEYCLRWLPPGTHQYARFIRPSELAAVARQAGLAVIQCQGMGYAPFLGQWRLCQDIRVNYIMHCVKL